jgi:hypothetical protein
VSASADEKTVNTTVTPVVIAISVPSTTLNYGNLPLGTQNAVPNPTNFTVTNDGTTFVNLLISGENTQGGWTLASAQGQDKYVHRYSISGTQGSWSPMSTTPETLKANLPPTDGGPDQQSVFLQLDMPTMTGSFNQQVMPVKITAIVP